MEVRSCWFPLHAIAINGMITLCERSRRQTHSNAQQLNLCSSASKQCLFQGDVQCRGESHWCRHLLSPPKGHCNRAAPWAAYCSKGPSSSTPIARARVIEFLDANWGILKPSPPISLMNMNWDCKSLLTFVWHANVVPVVYWLVQQCDLFPTYCTWQKTFTGPGWEGHYFNLCHQIKLQHAPCRA